MTLNTRLGLLLRIGTVQEALACAALMGATVIRTHNELVEGTRCLVDTELADRDDVVLIGQRFRMLGVELIVSARPGSDVPFGIRRNLTGLTGHTADS
jgi:hypothetical protein